ncbi:MAG: hypothetical protein ABH823_01070 [bacterium]
MRINGALLLILTVTANPGEDKISAEIAAYAKQRPGSAQPDAAYLRGLIKDAGLTLAEVRQVLKAGQRGDGIARLMLYALVKKAQKKKLMSARYNHFLATVSHLLKAGKLHLTMKQLTSSAGDLGPEYIIKEDKLDLRIYPGQFADQAGLAEFEGDVLHELYHAYQDQDETPLWRSEMEANGHLASADYRLHAYPDTMTDSWISIIGRPDGTLAMPFTVPRSTAQALKGKSVKTPELDEIRSKFLTMELALTAINSPEAKHYSRQAAAFDRQGKDIPLTIKQMLAELKDSTGKHLSFRTGGNGQAIPQYSSQLGIVLGLIRYTVKQQTDAQNQLDQFAMIFERKAALPPPGTDHQIDMIMEFDGIK